MQQISFDRLAPWILRLAAVHCIVWGGFVVLWPERSARVYGLNGPVTDEYLWKGTGLVIALLGVGYAIASRNPRRHYAVVLIGLLARIFGPIGLLWSVVAGELPVSVLILLPLNDLIWLVPFVWIVKEGWQSD